MTAPLNTGPLRRVAKLVTDVLSPAVLVASVLLVVAWTSSDTVRDAVTWGLIAAAAASLIPITYILRGVRRGQLTDQHVTVREQRTLPLLVCLGSTAAGTACLAIAGAPRELLALIACMVAALAVAVPITLALKWKVSIHALVAGGVAGTFVILYGPALAVAFLPATLVGWSRVYLRDHTAAQVLVGAAIGLASTMGLYPILL